MFLYDPLVCATAADIPVVGVAITAVRPVPGCGTGASRETDIEEAVRFCLEVAKSYEAGTCRFYGEAEFALLEKLYGSFFPFVDPISRALLLKFCHACLTSTF